MIEVEFGKIVKRTEKAVCLSNFDGTDNNQWIPDSVIDVLDPDGLVTMKEWFYDKIKE
jgi:hypothetical protein